MNDKIIISILVLFLVFATPTESGHIFPPDEVVSEDTSTYFCECSPTNLHSEVIDMRYVSFMTYIRKPKCDPVDVYTVILLNRKELCLDPKAKWVKKVFDESLNRQREAQRRFLERTQNRSNRIRHFLGKRFM